MAMDFTWGIFLSLGKQEWRKYLAHKDYETAYKARDYSKYQYMVGTIMTIIILVKLYFSAICLHKVTKIIFYYHQISVDWSLSNSKV